MRILLIFCLFFAFLNAKDFRVIQVIDGDTVDVFDGRKKTRLRLWGIDAPEKAQKYGAFCTKKLAHKIAGKKIQIEKKGTDKYERSIAKIYLGKEDINRFMVQSGCAWAYTYYTKAYKNDEIKARKQKIGLWQQKNPQNPYEYRKKKEKEQKIKKDIIILHALDSLE